MTNFCALQRGFFTLHNCDRPAVTNCNSCGRPACQFHLAVSSGFQTCIDCAHQQNQHEYLESENSDWLYSYRNRYYSRGYQPFMYSQSDYNSFNTQFNDSENYDDSETGDFSDS